MAKFIALEDGAIFRMGQGFSRTLISPDSGGRNITLNYSVFQEGQEFPQHLHDVSADIFIVLRGGVSVRQGDVYTPIQRGDFVYIPPGEVHGTVNDSGAEANLISFQSPPDPALYSGDRDPSQTGVTPQPRSEGESKVRIESMWHAASTPVEQARRWSAANPDWGAREMSLSYLELDPGTHMAREERGGGESVVFVWEGEARVQCGDQVASLVHGGSVLLDPDEDYRIANKGEDTLKLIRCTATST